MTTLQKIACTAIVAIFLWLTWFFRYDIQVGGGGSGGDVPVPAFAYVLDRWTGVVHVISPTWRRTF